MAAEHWFRSHHGAPTDKKWLAVARKAKCIPGAVAVTWWALMDHASQNNPRGSVAGFDYEGLDVFMGFEDGTAARITDVFRKHRTDSKQPPMIDGDVISTWEKRQPRREDASTERVRKHRERTKSQPDTPTDPSPCNAVKRDVTLETETEERRDRGETENKEHPPVSPRDEGKAEAAAEMMHDLNVDTSNLDEPFRTRMRAGAKAIIGGDDKATWRHPDNANDEVPWPRRPAIFRTALAECFGEGMYTPHALASKIRYQVKRALSPLPPRVAPGSEAAVVGTIPRNRDGTERYTRSGTKSGDLSAPAVSIAGGKVQVNADTAAFDAGTTQTAEVAAWMKEHVAETDVLRDRVAREVTAAGRDPSDPSVRLDSQLKLRELVRLEIAKGAAA